MYRHILCLGLLTTAAQGVYAAECDVEIALKGDSVEFDPFSPEATQLSLMITPNQAHTNVSVKFASSIKSAVFTDNTSDTPLLGASTLTGYPDYLIGNTTFTRTYFDSNTTTFADVATNVNWPNTNPYSYPISVKPDSQSQSDTALSALESTLTLPVIIEGTNGTTPCMGTHNVTMAINIPTRTAVSFSEANLSNDGGSLDAKTVGRDAAVSETSTLYVWSNATYKIKAVSDNGGVMVREQGSGGVNDNEINKLPYKLSFRSASNFFLGKNNITATTGSPVASVLSADEGATLVKGGRIGITFTTIDTGKRAGSYTDTVTISILPQL